MSSFGRHICCTNLCTACVLSEPSANNENNKRERGKKKSDNVWTSPDMEVLSFFIFKSSFAYQHRWFVCGLHNEVQSWLNETLPWASDQMILPQDSKTIRKSRKPPRLLTYCSFFTHHSDGAIRHRCCAHPSTIWAGKHTGVWCVFRPWLFWNRRLFICTSPSH